MAKPAAKSVEQPVKSKTSRKSKPKVEAAAEVTTVDDANSPLAAGSSKLADSGVAQSKSLAKSGKRSRKAVEAEVVAEQKAAAKSTKVEAPAPKPAPLVAHQRSRGKKYRAVLEHLDVSKPYELSEAIELAQKTNPAKFDAAVELHLNLGVDPRQADQAVRGTVVLPAGTGKSRRVAVVAPSAKQAEAKAAGADLVGEDDLVAQIESGQINFDVLIATPDCMPKLAKVARVLGPKGLMPNPKSGTVTADVGAAVKDAKGGKVEFRLDKQAIIHQVIGRVSFKVEDLQRNASALIGAITKSRPAAAKGTFIKTMTMATTMGPGIKLNVTKVLAEVRAKK